MYLSSVNFVFRPGVLLPGVFWPGVLLPGVFWTGVLLPGVFWLGVLLPGVFWPSVLLQGVFWPIVFWPGVFWPSVAHLLASIMTILGWCKDLGKHQLLLSLSIIGQQQLLPSVLGPVGKLWGTLET